MKQSNIENLIQFELLDNCVLSGGFYWRRIGKKKPPVELGVDKKSYSKRKDLLW